MTAKKAPEGVTKKHIARAERDRALRNRIVGGTIAVALLVIGLLGYGWYQSQVVEPRQSVALVNGHEILTGELQARVRFGQWNLVNQISNIQQFLTFIGDDPDLLANYQNQVVSLQQQLANPEFLGSSQLDLLIAEHLIMEEASRRGITVAEADVDQAIEEAFGFFAAGTPTPEPSPSPAAMLDSTATPVEESQLELTPTADAEGTPQPSATPYTRDLFEVNFRVYLDSLKPFRIDEEDVRGQFRARMYRERVQQEFESEVSTTQDQVWARHILVADEALAAELLGRVEAGESWEELAAEFSEDESNKDDGGDLDWFGRGQMVEAFEQAAFQGEIGEIAGPVETDFGWHLIEVLGHEMRELDRAGIELEISRAFQEWLSAQLESADISIADNWNQHLPAPPLLTP